MNSSGRRLENAQKAAVPLNNYEFDFGLGSTFSSHQSSKSLKDQKYNHTPTPSSTQYNKPASPWTPNKPSWTPQPSPSSPSLPGQAGMTSGWSGQSGFSSGWSGQPQPAPMAGDIFGKSWAKADSSKHVTSGIVGGPNAGAAPHLFGDLVGAALGKAKSNTPLKEVSSYTSFSMGSVSAALPKGGTPLKDCRSASGSVEEFGDFADQHTSQKNVSTGKISADNQPGDPFPSVNNENTFGEFQKPSASTGNEDPFAASFSVAGDLFGGISAPNSLDAGDPLADFSFGASKVTNAGMGFTDPLTSFTSSGKGTAPGKATDPFEMLNKSFSTQKQPSQEKSKDPLDSLFSSSTAATSGGFASQPFSETDDWGMDTDFVSSDSGTTTELEGLPPPPTGVTVLIAKDKGMENYKQGQFADAIKWFSWAMVLLEKRGDGNSASLEVLTCRASCYKEVGEYKKAVADCSKVLDQDNANASVLLQRALLYESTEKYKLGVEDLRNVLKIDPGNRLAKSTLSRLIKMAG